VHLVLYYCTHNTRRSVIPGGTTKFLSITKTYFEFEVIKSMYLLLSTKRKNEVKTNDKNNAE